MLEDQSITHRGKAMADFQDISEYIRISKDAMALLRTAVGFLPRGGARDEVERKIQDADEALRRSDAKLAKDLGYPLCECTFPPQIMLSKGRDAERGVKIFNCPACGEQEPSEHKLRQFDRLKDYNQSKRGTSWVDVRRRR